MVWDTFGTEILESVLPHAEWLTGMPVPSRPKTVKPKLDDADSAMLAAMDDDDL